MASRKDSVRPYTRTEQVQTTLTLGEREQLDVRAFTDVVSRADLIRRFILEGLKRSTPEQPQPVDDSMAEQQRVRDEYHAAMQKLQAIRRANQS